jgi:hypothetical protein
MDRGMKTIDIAPGMRQSVGVQSVGACDTVPSMRRAVGLWERSNARERAWMLERMEAR